MAVDLIRQRLFYVLEIESFLGIIIGTLRKVNNSKVEKDDLCF